MPSWIDDDARDPSAPRVRAHVHVVGLPRSGRTALLAGLARATDGGCLPSTQHAVWLAEPVPALYARADRQRAQSGRPEGAVAWGWPVPDGPIPAVRVHAERVGGSALPGRPTRAELRFVREGEARRDDRELTVVCVDAADRRAGANLAELSALLPTRASRVLLALTKADRLVGWAGALVSPRRLLGTLDAFEQAEAVLGGWALRSLALRLGPEVELAVALTSAWGPAADVRMGGPRRPPRRSSWNPVGLAEAAVWLAFGAVLPGVRPITAEERAVWALGDARTRVAGRAKA